MRSIASRKKRNNSFSTIVRGNKLIVFLMIFLLMVNSLALTVLAEAGNEEVVFIEDNLPDYQVLLNAVKPGMRVYTLDAQKDGLAQMADILSSEQGIAAIHLLSHGAEGKVDLGSLILSNENIGDNSDKLNTIGDALKKDGDLLVYGCDVAKTEAGNDFIAKLAKLSGADVAASDGTTGVASEGGDWTLERRTGKIETHALSYSEYGGTLDNINVTSATNVTLLDGVADRIIFPTDSSLLACGGNWQPDNLSISPVAVVSGFNAAEDKIDLSNTLLSVTPTPVFDTDVADNQTYNIYGTDTTYTSYGYGFYNGKPFSISGNVLSAGGTNTGILVGYTDDSWIATYVFFQNVTGTITASNFILPGAAANTAPAFIGGTTSLSVNQNSGANDIKQLLHVSDTDLSQSLQWSQASDGAPAHGTLSFSGAVASSGSPDITPGGTVTYTPAAGYTGSDSFKVQVSDGTATATRTITVTVNDVTAPTVSSINRQTPAGGSTNADSVVFRVTFNETVTGVDTSDFTLTLAGTVSGNIASVSSVSGAVFDITVNNISGDGAIRLDLIAGATVEDGAGNNIATDYTSGQVHTLDNTAPIVNSVSVPANDTYTAGENLDFTVNFNENVTVNTGGGTPYIPITLSTGGTVNAIYQSGTGTSDLVFRYTIAAGNGDADGIDLGAAITANGGTIRDSVGNDAVPALYNAGSTAGVLVDAIVPVVNSVSVPANDTYTAGENLNFTVNFNENVTVNTGGGTPYIPITLSTGGTVNAIYQSGTGTSALVFRYTIAAGNGDADGIAMVAAITANGGTIRDSAGNDATLVLNSIGSTTGIIVDAIAPAVSSVSVPANGTYTTGQNLDFTVNFNENVTVNAGGGTPYMPMTLSIGGTVNAEYQSGSGTSALVFRYTIAAGNGDADGIAMVAAITANGGTIRDSAGNDATLVLNSIGSTTGIIVDAIAPVVSSVSVPANGIYTTGQSLNFTVNFSENVTVNTGGGVPYLPITLSTGGTVSADYQGGSGTNALVFGYTVAAGNEDADGIAIEAALSPNGADIKDAVGNDAMLTLNGVGATGAVLVDTVKPVIGTATLSASNTYIDITFAEGIYGANDGATALSTGKLSLTFTQNAGAGGAATGAVVDSITKSDGITALSGGETTVRVFLTITGTPSGVETVEIKPADGSSMYDKAGNAMSESQTTGAKPLNDEEAPMVGNGGTIAAAEGATTIDLAWTEAADTITVQENLQYKIVSSGSDNINTVDNAEANGTIVQDWTDNMSSVQAAGLAQGTVYYFNIIVKDEAGNKAVYTTVTKTTTIAEINIKGNGTSIADGDMTPSSSDNTDFGSADILTGAIEETYTIENTGTGVLNLTGTPKIAISGAAAADFTVIQEPQGTIAASGSTSFRITFDPNGEGLRSATISINNDDTDENPYNFEIQGTGTATPEMDIKGDGASIADGDITPASTDNTDFGSTDIAGGTIAKAFTIENSGSAAVTLGGTPKIAISGANAADFTVTQQPEGTIAPAGSTSFQVTFDPSAAGSRTATISIMNNDSNEDPYNFDIKGTGIVAPEINIKGNGNSIADGDTTPDNSDGTDFGDTEVSGGMVERTYTIENIGSGVLNLNGAPKIAISGANAADFTVVAGPDGTVAAAGSTTVRIAFDPTGKGVRTATISITNDDSDENPYNYDIRGSGTDSTEPTPGGSGSITIASTAANSIALDWMEATDDGTAQEDLQYLVVYSDSSNIDTVSNAVYNGTTIAGWTADLTSAVATGLTAETTYYFNVVVKDEEGNEAAYQMVSGTTAEASDITAPIAGSSGTITTDNITSSSVDLSWARAADNKTADEDLEYRVVYSGNDNISTVNHALNNGTISQDWTADLTGHTTAGLDSDTTYYFNIIVRDEAYNMTVYEAVYGSTLAAADTIEPIVGGGGEITAFNATTSSIQIAWTAGTDNSTMPADLLYKVVRSNSNNISTIADASANGTIVQNWTANLTGLTATGLNDGTTYYFNVIISDEAGNKAIYTTAAKATLRRSNDRDDSDEDDDPSPPAADETDTTQTDTTVTEIIINDKIIDAGTTTTETVDENTVTTVTVDDEMIEEKLNAEGNNATIVIPVYGGSDVVVGVLNGQTVKNMEEKDAILKIETEDVTYTLPASEINIDSISAEIGQQVALKDIKISITISEPSAVVAKVVEDSANKNSYQLVVKPVEFNITCSSGDRTVEVSKFNGYVERTIAIPEGVDPSKITTGIVLNNDGTFSHVPTTIVVIDGKYYAKINSLTNSIYSVIWRPKAFKDVESHWAKDAINDMGSRLVINGADKENYAPDRDITRGEFAAIIVKGLGLMRTGTGKNIYSDVNKTDWYYDAVYIANEYGLINGTGNSKFAPERKISREEAMLVIARAMSITKLNTRLSEAEIEKQLGGYKDRNEINNWAKKSVAVCIKNGIVLGSGENINTAENITRAEVAVIVRRLLKKSNLI